MCKIDISFSLSFDLDFVFNCFCDDYSAFYFINMIEILYFSVDENS